MTQILSAQPVVEKIKKDLILRCEGLKRRGVVPCMSVVLVGDNPASLSYIRNKKRMCEEIGAKFTLHQLPLETSIEEFEKKIQELNDDQSINGIIIQLPVSEKLKSLNITNMVNPAKDIDGFHGVNTQLLYAGTSNLNYLLPCTPKGIINLLSFYRIGIEGKHVVVIGRSLIVGKPLSMLLSNYEATVTLAHSKTRDLRSLTRMADIIISATGVPHLVDATYIDPDRKTVVIDVGLSTLNGKLTGDVDQETVRPHVAAISPVPGGVGPMTVISLIENLITATENQLKG